MIRRILKSRRVARSPVSRFNEKTLGRLVDLFQILSDPSRLRILLSLHETGEQNVNAICEQVSQPQPAVSFHLKKLFEEGMLNRRREGKFTFYSIASDFEQELLLPIINRISLQAV